MKQHTNGFATPPHPRAATSPPGRSPLPSQQARVLRSGQLPVCHTAPAWQEPGQAVTGRQRLFIVRGGGPSPPWPPQLLLHVALWDEHVSGRSVYLQVSDVVHDSPTLDGKALGRDVVVVDLQRNGRISERPSSHTPSHTGKQSMCHHSTSPCGGGCPPHPSR